MAIEYQTVPQMYERLQVMIRQRKDTGFRLAVTDAWISHNVFAKLDGLFDRLFHVGGF